jgi:signal transduction histidine kinase
VVVLALIAAAITAVLSHSQPVGFITWVLLLFVSGCFAGSYLALRTLLVPRLEPTLRSTWGRLAVHAVIVLTGVGMGGEIAARTLALLGGDPVSNGRRKLLPVGLAITVAMVLVEGAYRRLRRRVREHELREERLRRQLVQAELGALRARTDPHFLFNSLNTVAGLVDEDPARASDVLQRLAALFRYALDGSRVERVRLADELRAARAYLEVESLRFGDRLRWALEVDDALLDWPVPPLLLQPLVENAVTHGIAPRRGTGQVAVRAAERDGRLVLEVEDDGLGGGTSEDRGSGTALSDLAERLALSFAGEASLEWGPRPQGGYRVRIVLPRGAEVAP